MVTWSEFISKLGFVLAVDGCARGCLHCPAFGSTQPVARAPMPVLEKRLSMLAEARSRLGIGAPARVVHCWRISDPLDYAMRQPDGTVAACADVAELWRVHLNQGLYVVTNGSEARPQAMRALSRIAAQPDLVSQVKLTITPADTAWGSSRYETAMADDVATLAPLWQLRSTRSEDPEGHRFRINIKCSPDEVDEVTVKVERILRDAGVTDAQELIQDAACVAIKPIYDLGNALGTPSPVAGALKVVNMTGERFKPTPDARPRIQYGVRPDGRLFVVDMYAFAERDLIGEDGHTVMWPNEFGDLDSLVTA